MKLSSKLNKTRRVDVEFDGESVSIEYRAHAYTPNFVKRLDAHTEDRALFQIQELVTHWDVLDDDGKEIPPTEENLRGMPMQFLIAVLEAIDSDVLGWSKDQKKS